MTDYSDDLRFYIDTVKDSLDSIDVDELDAAVNLIQATYDTDRTIYIFGNGGSGATASYFQNDFNKGISEYTEKKFHVHCLNDNVSTIMAIANDRGYADIFRFQLNGHLRKGDIVIALSGSGNSANIVKAVEFAKECGNKVIALTGFDGGKTARMADVSLHVPVDSMQVAEDVHLAMIHAMMVMFYKTLCGIDHMKDPGEQPRT